MSFSTVEKDVPTQQGSERLIFFSCQPLTKAGFPNAFSTRLGGVSFNGKELNLSFLHDDKENVDENRRRFLLAIGQSKKTLRTVRQIHSDKLLWVEPGQWEEEKNEADALGTIEGSFSLGVKTADCLPILIGDPRSGIFCAIHAGWKGTLAKIVPKTIQWLEKNNGFSSETAIAALGPYACGNCYLVREDVFSLFQRAGFQTSSFVKKGADQWGFDSGVENKKQLLESGLRLGNIYTFKKCTICEPRLFFSHRRDGSSKGPEAKGRLLSVIGKD